jgi:hypothetical protein
MLWLFLKLAFLQGEQMKVNIIPPMCKECLYLVKAYSSEGDIKYSCRHKNGCKLKGKKKNENK